MKKLYMDISRGISGDMFISALADLGVDFGLLEKKFNEAGLDVRIERVSEKRNGITGIQTRISWSKEQPMRTLKQIVPVIEGLGVSDSVKEKSVNAFKRLAQVEAQVHGLDLNEIHFHEVGALDTLVDVAGAFWGLEVLSINNVQSSPMPWFQGEVDISHGTVSLPAPATALLMQGKSIVPSDYDWEIITPTGALLVDQLDVQFSKGFEGKLISSGLGYGSSQRGFNGLRVFLIEEEQDEFVRDQVWLLESNIDHMTGEELGVFLEKIMDAGALDVIFLQGIMKKNRPGGQLQVICALDDLYLIRDAFFRHSLTLGIRVSKVSRSILLRNSSFLEIGGQKIAAKETVYSGRVYKRPEMEDLKKAAEKGDGSVVGLLKREES